MISWPAANGMAASRAVPMQTDAPSGTTRAIASRSETSLEADTPLNSTGSAGVFKRVGAARAAHADPRGDGRRPGARERVGRVGRVRERSTGGSDSARSHGLRLGSDDLAQTPERRLAQADEAEAVAVRISANAHRQEFERRCPVWRRDLELRDLAGGDRAAGTDLDAERAEVDAVPLPLRPVALGHPDGTGEPRPERSPPLGGDPRPADPIPSCVELEVGDDFAEQVGRDSLSDVIERPESQGRPGLALRRRRREGDDRHVGFSNRLPLEKVEAAHAREVVIEAQEDRVRRRRREAVEGEIDAGHDQRRVARLEQERLQTAGDTLFILHDEDPHFREARTLADRRRARGGLGWLAGLLPEPQRSKDRASNPKGLKHRQSPENHAERVAPPDTPGGPRHVNAATPASGALRSGSEFIYA